MPAAWPEPWWGSSNGETELRLYVGDARAVLPALSRGSVHAVMTSPPYWGLRDYGLEPSVWGGEPSCAHEWRPARRDGLGGSLCARCGAWLGQLGLEPTPDLYVEHLVGVFDLVRDVLRDDGTCWVNLGDVYAGSNPLTSGAGAPAKSLVGVPWRFALAMSARGWILRNAVVWAKPDALPSSAKDRLGSVYEHVFLFVKSARYWFDLDAIRRPYADPAHAGRRFNVRLRDAALGRLGAKYGGLWRASAAELAMAAPGAAGASRGGQAAGANPGDVWAIPHGVKPDGGHWSAYPEALCEPTILAGCPPLACRACGRGAERVTETRHEGVAGRAGYVPPQSAGTGGGTVHSRFGRADAVRVTVGWRAGCGHGTGWAPGVVLDPFAGTGTTLAVAQRLGRSAVGIEAKAEFAEIARRRLEAEHRQMRMPLIGGGL